MFGMKQNVVDGGKNAYYLHKKNGEFLISFGATLNHEEDDFSNEELMKSFSAKFDIYEE